MPVLSLSTSTGLFTKIWKIIRVQQIPKKVINNTFPENYRPIGVSHLKTQGKTNNFKLGNISTLRQTLWFQTKLTLKSELQL